VDPPLRDRNLGARHIETDLFFWVLARVAGLTSFATLAISLVTGLALRTAVLDWLGSNRALRSVHEFSAALWIPLGAVHVLALVLDRTARIGLPDLLIPFRIPYGTLGIGLGTLSLELVALVAVTGWLRRRLNPVAWQWVHRLGYLGFGLVFLHALLTGSDFGDPAVSALTWSTAAVLAVLATARALWGRLPA
jgi:DMSO/TMAO reductase YedYZ heme-binding membrane subunit